MNVPRDHSRRVELNDEVHARPPEALRTPARLSCMALMLDGSGRERERELLAGLAAQAGTPAPGPGDNHFSVGLGGFRLKWERHTEFSRYIFIVEGPEPHPFAEPALGRVPDAFLSGLPGEIIAAAHVSLRPGREPGASLDELAAAAFGGHALVGAEIGEGAAAAFTDFRIHPDRFSRVLIEDRSLTPRQAGRLVQRLFEIDVYKTMALLAFPVARELVPVLGAAERELAAITTALAEAGEPDEDALLDRLTRLDAELERRGAANQFRFGAAAAYFELVERRIAELRERRIAGLQTFDEFIARRLGPAMTTCAAAASRQEALSGRVARATQLLSTRVALRQTRQSQGLLRSMNRRAQLQLRLQETVEGLSIAAVTYYVVGLLGYALKGLKPLGLGLDVELATALGIPVVLGLAALGVWRVRRSVGRDAKH